MVSMAKSEEEKLADSDVEADDEDREELEDDDAPLPDEDLEEFESEVELEDEEGIENEVKLSQRELEKVANARSLEVRRAIEARVEAKRLKDDLDYLDLED